MENISTGTGIALLAGAIVAYPILDRVMPEADASASHAATVVAAATAQVEPTIVWYGSTSSVVYRAWSDGRIEATASNFYQPTGGGCYSAWNSATCGWVVISDPSQGLNFRSDINFDSKVDGADLGTLLADWDDAPRHDIPPSDCPMALISP